MGHPLKSPWQSLGGRLVSSLAARLVLSLFPSSTTFFRYDLSEADLEEAAADAASRDMLAAAGITPEEFPAAVRARAAQREREIVSAIESGPLRSKLNETFKHLEIAGNALLFLKPDGDIRLFGLSSFVARRDTSGNLLELIVHEKIHYTALDETMQAAVDADAPMGPDAASRTKEYPLYTHIERTNKTTYTLKQYVGSVLVPTATTTYPADRLPWLHLRWTTVDGEPYGRSLMDDLYGDLHCYDLLRQALAEGAVAAGRVVNMVRAGATTNLRVLKNAANNTYMIGDANEVSQHRQDQTTDFGFVEAVAAGLKRDLEQSFLVSSAVTRDAERVTAEEIRFLAQELETNFGGLYSTLGRTLQLPVVTIYADRVQRQRKLPAMPPSVNIVIVTGLEALSRSHELTKLVVALESARRVLGNAIDNEIDTRKGLDVFLLSGGVESGAILKSPAQRQQEQEAAQAQSLMDQVTPHLAKSGSEALFTQPPATA